MNNFKMFLTIIKRKNLEFFFILPLNSFLKILIKKIRRFFQTAVAAANFEE